MDENKSTKQQPNDMSKTESVKLEKSEAEGQAQRQQTTDGGVNAPEEVNASSSLKDEQYFEKFIPQVSLKMNHLNNVNDFISKECLDDLKFLYDVYRSGTIAQKRKLGDELTSFGVAELFQKIWKKYFEMDFLSNDNDLMGEIMTKVLNVMRNYTDSSHVLCEKVYRIGLYDPILSYLGSTYLDPGKTRQPDFKRIISGLMGILHNMLQKVSDSREVLREKKAASRVQRFRRSPNEMVACKALIIQGYVITEEENEIVNSDETTFQFMKKILENALESPDHRAKNYGLKAIEIIEALNRLAVNDRNKMRIVCAGLLPLYVKMLQPQNSTAEQAAAAGGIWSLEFRCKTEVENEPGCIQALQNLVNTNSEEVVVTQAKGALWVLEQSKNKSRAPKEISKSSSLADGAGCGHIFISYQWDTQPVIMKLSDSLKRAGYNVWVDLDKMRGSILEAMAEAVENAVVVIICMTAKYKESNNCRSEAVYSRKKEKQIVPLLLQSKYNPNGWLGILAGDLLYYDFSSEEKYDGSLNGLTKELGHRGKASASDIPDGQEVATRSMCNVLHSQTPNSMSKFDSWSTDDVQIWLKDNGMENFQKWLHEVDGSLLMQYRSMSQKAPETFYSMLEKKDFSLHDILRLSKALDQLR